MGKFLAGPVGSWARVFVMTVLGLWLADLLDVGKLHFDLSEWQVWITAGLVAVLPVIIAWFNPADPRFGKKAE